jgi:hypothetical protein
MCVDYNKYLHFAGTATVLSKSVCKQLSKCSFSMAIDLGKLIDFAYQKQENDPEAITVNLSRKEIEECLDCPNNHSMSEVSHFLLYHKISAMPTADGIAIFCNPYYIYPEKQLLEMREKLLEVISKTENGKHCLVRIDQALEYIRASVQTV